MIGLFERFHWIRDWLWAPPAYRFDFAEAKRRCRIVIIDDDTTALPLNEIKDDDYNIEQYKSIDHQLLRQCETNIFDIIILDYNGVAPRSITPDDGFGVFNRIRKANPEQYIIAISAQTYDISKTAYFKEANDWLKKPTELITTKDKIDTGIRFLFDRTLVLGRLNATLTREGFSQKTIRTIENRIQKSNYTDLDQLTDMVKRISNVTEISTNTIGILRAILKLGAL